MDRLREAIEQRGKWGPLINDIEEVERFKVNKNSAKALESAKSILEHIAITIAKDHGVEIEENPDTGKITKKAFEVTPLIKFLDKKDIESSKSILNAFATIAKNVGELRNRHGVVSHGKDIYAEKIDDHSLLFAVESCDLLASYLVQLDTFDSSQRVRVDYDDYPLFNKKIDNEQDDQLEVSGILLSPSRALYGADIESYKEKLYEHQEDKKELISKLCNSKSYVDTRKACCDLLDTKDYLNDDDIKQIVLAFLENSQINNLLKHGYTQNLYKWLINEKSIIIEGIRDGILLKFKELEQKSIY